MFFNGLKNIYYFKFAFPHWHKELFYAFVCFIYLFLYICFNISYDVVLVLFLPSKIMLTILKHFHFRMKGLIPFLILSFKKKSLLSLSSIFCLSHTLSISPSLLLHSLFLTYEPYATATAKSLQSCPTLCNPIDGSPPGSPIPGILQARVMFLELLISNL